MKSTFVQRATIQFLLSVDPSDTSASAGSSEGAWSLECSRGSPLHWGGPDPVDEEEKDHLAKNLYIHGDCAMNVDLHSRALLSNKHLTKST